MAVGFSRDALHFDAAVVGELLEGTVVAIGVITKQVDLVFAVIEVEDELSHLVDCKLIVIMLLRLLFVMSMVLFQSVGSALVMYFHLFDKAFPVKIVD